MNRYLLYTTLLFLILTVPVTASADDYSIQFGIMKETSRGDLVVTEETTVIPLITRETGFIFGFSIKADHNKTFTTQAMHYLPEKPEHLSAALSGNEYTDEHTALKTPKEHHREYVGYPIRFDRGDPVGDYKVEIFINDNLVKTIQYEVIPYKEYEALKSKKK